MLKLSLHIRKIKVTWTIELLKTTYTKHFVHRKKLSRHKVFASQSYSVQEVRYFWHLYRHVLTSMVRDGLIPTHTETSPTFYRILRFLFSLIFFLAIICTHITSLFSETFLTTQILFLLPSYWCSWVLRQINEKLFNLIIIFWWGCSFIAACHFVFSAVLLSYCRNSIKNHFRLLKSFWYLHISFNLLKLTIWYFVFQCASTIW